MNEFPLEIPTRECRIAIVASEFNHFIVQQLVDGAFDALGRNSISEQNISLIWVPGAYELPLVADVLAGAGQHDAVIALGAVIRGGTPHFDYVAGECSRGLAQVALKHELPVIFHCGYELSGTMLLRSSPRRILKVRDKFPALKIIAAHFGGFKLWPEVKEYLLGKDIYLDTSFFFDYLPPAEVKELLINHRQDRLLFGTDFPLIDQGKDLSFLNSLDIPIGLKKKILFSNAAGLLAVEN